MSTNSVKEIEEFALSAMMMATQPEDFEDLIDFVKSDDFGIPGHGDLFEAIVDAHDASGGEDRGPAMVWSQLVKKGLADTLQREGIDKRAIERIYALSVSTAVGRQYTDIVRQHGGNRRLAGVGAQIVDIARQNLPLEDALNEVDTLIDTAVSGRNSYVVDIQEGIEEYEAALLGIKPMRYHLVPTHFPFLDRVFEGGIPTNTINFFTAPSHHGKSTVLRNIAARMAYCERDRVVVAWNPIEEGTEKLRDEIVSFWTGHSPWILDEPEPAERHCINFGRLSRIKGGIEKPTPADLQEIRNAFAIYRGSSIKLLENVTDRYKLQTAVRSLRRTNRDKILVVVIDYLDHMMPARPGETEVQHLTDTVRYMRHSMDDKQQMAKMGMYLVAAQLRSEANAKMDKVEEATRPLDVYDMTMIKGASSIHQAADSILGSLITVNGDRNGATMKAYGSQRRLHIDVMKNKISNRQDGGIFYQDATTGWLEEA